MLQPGECFTSDVKAFFAKLFKREPYKCSIVILLENAIADAKKYEEEANLGLERIKKLEESASAILDANTCAARENIGVPDDCDDIETYKKLLQAEKTEKCSMIREHAAAITNLKTNHSNDVRELEDSITRINKRHNEAMDKLSKDSADAILKAERLGAKNERERIEKLASENPDVKANIESSKKVRNAIARNKDKIAAPTNGETITRANGKRSFTDEQVINIRTRVNVNNEDVLTIAKEYGVNRTTIHRIANKTTYTDVN